MKYDGVYYQVIALTSGGATKTVHYRQFEAETRPLPSLAFESLEDLKTFFGEGFKFEDDQPKYGFFFEKNSRCAFLYKFGGSYYSYTDTNSAIRLGVNAAQSDRDAAFDALRNWAIGEIWKLEGRNTPVSVANSPNPHTAQWAGQWLRLPKGTVTARNPEGEIVFQGRPRDFENKKRYLDARYGEKYTVEVETGTKDIL